MVSTSASASSTSRSRSLAAPHSVVLVSGQARASDRVRATLAGSDAYMTKPFGKQDLVRVLESCGMTLLPTLTLPVGDRPRA